MPVSCEGIRSPSAKAEREARALDEREQSENKQIVNAGVAVLIGRLRPMIPCNNSNVGRNIPYGKERYRAGLEICRRGPFAGSSRLSCRDQGVNKTVIPKFLGWNLFNTFATHDPVWVFLGAKRKAAMADRIGIATDGREELAPPKSERFSYRFSLLINLAASAALYTAGFLIVRAVFRLFSF